MRSLEAAVAERERILEKREKWVGSVLDEREAALSERERTLAAREEWVGQKLEERERAIMERERISRTSLTERDTQFVQPLVEHYLVGITCLATDAIAGAASTICWACCILARCSRRANTSSSERVHVVGAPWMSSISGVATSKLK